MQDLKCNLIITNQKKLKWQTAYIHLLTGRLGGLLCQNLHKNMKICFWEKEKSTSIYQDFPFV